MAAAPLLRRAPSLLARAMAPPALSRRVALGGGAALRQAALRSSARATGRRGLADVARAGQAVQRRSLRAIGLYLGAGGVVAIAASRDLWLDYALGPSRDDEAEAAREELEKRERQEEVRKLASQASWRRLAEVIWTMLPVVFAWPLWLVNPPSFWSFVAVRVDCCGPTFVKLAQWLATRRDLFPDSVCTAFSGLHNQVAARWSVGLSSSEVEAALREHEVTLRSIEPKAHASGSIAEVFFATLSDGSHVAVKCLRPGVKALLEADLALLLRLTEWADGKFERARLLGVRRAAEDFAEHVKMQTDLEQEAMHLRRFRANFADGVEVVRFPNPLYVTPEALVLSRETGQELSEVFKFTNEISAASSIPADPSGLVSAAAAAASAGAARADEMRKSLGLSPEDLKHMARQSMAAYMRMIFNDQFIHGDLHPGNIMLQVRPKDSATDGSSAEDGESGPLGSRLRNKMRSWLPKSLRPGADGPEPGFELVILDAGLAIPLPKEKVEVLRSLAISIIYADFARAAEILYEQSPDSSQCWDPAGFKQGLAQAFRDCRRNVWEEGCVQVSDTCLRSLELVQHYKVGLDLTLTWTLFGMLSIEGSARQLDPEVDCARAATKYIITVPSIIREFRQASWPTLRHMVGELVFSSLGLDYWAYRERMGLTWDTLQE